jgi:hypothetical protein
VRVHDNVFRTQAAGLPSRRTVCGLGRYSDSPIGLSSDDVHATDRVAPLRYPPKVNFLEKSRLQREVQRRRARPWPAAGKQLRASEMPCGGQ